MLNHLTNDACELLSSPVSQDGNVAKDVLIRTLEAALADYKKLYVASIEFTSVVNHLAFVIRDEELKREKQDERV